jgi:Zn finger protein HypA/HybF involved in hydrogenase expression
MGLETENELEEAPPEQQIDNVVSSDFSSKPVKMYCQDCRKVKNHREIRERVFRCTHCKRATDLRVS